MPLEKQRNGKNSWECDRTINEQEINIRSALAEAVEREFLSPQEPENMIEVKSGDLPQMLIETIELLKKAKVQIFDRGGILFRPMRLTQPEDEWGIYRSAESLVLRTLDKDWLMLPLAQYINWVKFVRTARGYKRVDPPADLIRLLLAAPDAGNWPFLRAIVHTPVITAGGRLLNEPGYHTASGLYFNIDSAWDMPALRGQEGAAAAVDVLVRHLRNYQFVEKSDLGTALALLLTAVLRPVLPAAPAFAVDAPAAGSGKSLLIDVAAILATGAPAAVMDYGLDEVEAVKRLDACQLAGDQIIAIDNVERPLEGSTLSQMITQTARKIRPLGTSKDAAVPCTQLITITGNNLVIKGDMTRRVLLCRVDPGVERPELRKFDQNLRAETYEQRHALVTAILSISSAYLSAGSPGVGASPFGEGNFDDWNKLVRQPLIWAGVADPVETMARVRESDPDLMVAMEFYRAWWDVYGHKPVFLSELIDSIAPDGMSALNDEIIMFTAALENFAGGERGGKINQNKLGQQLRRYKDRPLENLVLRRKEERYGGKRRWSMEKLGGK